MVCVVVMCVGVRCLVSMCIKVGLCVLLLVMMKFFGVCGNSGTMCVIDVVVSVDSVAVLLVIEKFGRLILVKVKVLWLSDFGYGCVKKLCVRMWVMKLLLMWLCVVWLLLWLSGLFVCVCMKLLIRVLLGLVL